NRWLPAAQHAARLPPLFLRHHAPDVAASCILHTRPLQAGAAAEVKEHFAIQPDGSFTLDTMLIISTKENSVLAS
ncbi:MAG: hypothetical protein JHC88_20720, partial [Niveispirillum sp.]|nr:hypothetical protein [Niveispirillum sp.]